MHKAQHARCRGGIVDRCAKDDTVSLLHQRQHIRHGTAEDALARLGTAAAAYASAHRRPADVEDGGLNAFPVEDLGHLGESSIGAAFFMRAAVDQKYFHDRSSLHFNAGKFGQGRLRFCKTAA